MIESATGVSGLCSARLCLVCRQRSEDETTDLRPCLDLRPGLVPLFGHCWSLGLVAPYKKSALGPARTSNASAPRLLQEADASYHCHQQLDYRLLHPSPPRLPPSSAPGHVRIAWHTASWPGAAGRCRSPPEVASGAAASGSCGWAAALPPHRGAGVAGRHRGAGVAGRVQHAHQLPVRLKRRRGWADAPRPGRRRGRLGGAGREGEHVPVRARVQDRGRRGVAGRQRRLRELSDARGGIRHGARPTCRLSTCL